MAKKYLAVGEVYRRGKVFEDGEEVPPALEFENWREQLLASGRLREVEIEEDLDIYDVLVSDAESYVDDIDDVDYLVELYEKEIENPGYDNGRSGMLEAIENRINELEAED